MCVCVCVGQGLTSVREKAGGALRLHRTSVGEEAREEVEERKGGREEESEGGGGEREGGSASSALSTEAPSRGVLSTITYAVQNTVSVHPHSLTPSLTDSLPQSPRDKQTKRLPRPPVAIRGPPRAHEIKA